MAFENEMIIRLKQGHLFHESPNDGTTKLLVAGHNNFGSEQF
jgi:hypothetical protein